MAYILNNLKAGALGSKMLNVDIVETGFTDRTYLVVFSIFCNQ
jgi:hypothetical protein